MDSNKTSTSSSFGDDIFSFTYCERMSDIADVLTYARFRREMGDDNTVQEPPVAYGGSVQVKGNALFIEKWINAEIPTTNLAPTGKTGYAILGDSRSLSYLNFYLNTFWAKFKLSGGEISANNNSTTTLASLRNLVVVRNDVIEPSCIYLQSIINRLGGSFDWNGFDDMAKVAIIDCFRTVGDMIMFEMCIPKIFGRYELSLTLNWIKLVDSVRNDGNFDLQIRMLIRHLFNFGNPIREAINRMKVFRSEVFEAVLDSNSCK